MKRRILSILLTMTLVVGGLHITTSVEEVDAAQFAGTHFAMEFNNHDSANMEKAHGWSNGGMFNCTWQDGNVNFSNDGIMSLTINSNGSGGYTGGEYRSKQYFGYGMYQVNMKPIKNPGVVTSFFTYTGPTDGTIWDEIDIEFLGYDTTKVQFNYFSNGVGNHEYIHNLGFDASTSFHTYGFYWGPGTITWYVDGVAVYTVNSSDVPVTPGKIMMNVWPGTGVDSWLKPYNGVTPLTGYYDWAVYDAPGSGEQTTTQPQTTTPTVVETTTVGAGDGFVTAGSEWTNLNFWSVYFGTSWAGSTGYYKDGGSYNDFSIKIGNASTSDWGVQMKTQQLAVDSGKRYRATVKANANMASANQIRYKDEGSQTETLYKISQGSNIFELEFTASDFAQIFFDLGKAPAGLQLDIASFKLEQIEDVTVAPSETTTQAQEVQTTQSSGGNTGDYGSLAFQKLECTGTAGLNLEYAIMSSTVAGLVPWYGDGGNTLSLQFSADAGSVSDVKVNGQIPGTGVVTEKGLGLVKVNPNMLADNAYSEIRVVTETGEFSIVVRKGTPGSEMPTEEQTEAPTEIETEVVTEMPTEETTITQIEGGIEVNGYQISATVKGMRTVYSVENTINGLDVVSSGIVYSLVDYTLAEELYVGSPNKYVASFVSTEAGKCSKNHSDSDTATSYTMTMKFATDEAAEYTEKWRVCAYAKLSDGTYVYTEPHTYTIYDVANEIYQNGGMKTKEHHDYLYTGILSVVNKDYIIREFNRNNDVVEA